MLVKKYREVFPMFCINCLCLLAFFLSLVAYWIKCLNESMHFGALLVANTLSRDMNESLI